MCGICTHLQSERYDLTSTPMNAYVVRKSRRPTYTGKYEAHCNIQMGRSTLNSGQMADKKVTTHENIARIASFSRQKSRRMKPCERRLLSEMHDKYCIKHESLGEFAIFLQRFDQKVLEIGFGSGEHLVSLCTKNYGPCSVCIVGCEPYTKGVAQFMKKLESDIVVRHVAGTTQVAADGVDHNVCSDMPQAMPVLCTDAYVRVWQNDARILLDAVGDGTFDSVYILFPDPWPKTRHYKRRLINTVFLDLLRAKLSSDASVVIATDHEEYALWIKNVIAMHDYWCAVDSEYHIVDESMCRALGIVTKYAQRALKSGRLVHYFALHKRG